MRAKGPCAQTFCLLYDFANVLLAEAQLKSSDRKFSMARNSVFASVPNTYTQPDIAVKLRVPTDTFQVRFIINSTTNLPQNLQSYCMRKQILPVCVRACACVCVCANV